jgi:two-component system, NtrC family, sensor kinase
VSKTLKNLKLRDKFTALFLAILLIPFGSLTFFYLYMSKEVIERNTILHMQNLVEIKETVVEEWLNDRIRDGKILAESEEVKSLRREKISPYVNFKKAMDKSCREILVVDLRGNVLSPFTQQGSVAKEEWFKGAIKDRIYISPIMLSSNSEVPTFVISLQIRDRNEEVLGVLKEIVEMDYIAKLILESRFGKTGRLFLTDFSGNIIIHEQLPQLAARGISRVSYFDRDSLKSSHNALYIGFEGNEVLGAWKRIEGIQCYLIAEQDVKEAFHQTSILIRGALLIFILSTLMIVFIAYWVSGTLTRPIKLLSEKVASFAEGNFQEAMVIDRKDEIGDLMEGFTKMAARLQKAYGELEGKVKASNTELENAYHLLKKNQEQLIRAEKMAALGHLSAGVAHEIRNPLTSIKLFIQTLEKEIDLDENQQEDFRIIRKEIDHLNEIVVRFLIFARPDEPKLESVNLYRLIVNTLNLLMATIKAHGIQLEVSLSPDLPKITADSRQLEQVLLNILLNAIEAMPNGGTLALRSSIEVDSDTLEEFLQLVIRDTGPGIDEQDKTRLFDPFFTTKEGGTGLGLSIAYTILQKHNGKIAVMSEVGRGASFLLSLPISEEDPWKK